MKPCAHDEAIETLALGAGRGEGTGIDDALEAHVAECDACSMALDRALEERALFVRRAEAMERMGRMERTPLEPSGVFAERIFAEVERRRDRARSRGATLSLLAAAATCMFVALVGARAAGVCATAEPDRGSLAATATADDELMTSGIAACGTLETPRSCVGPAMPRMTTGSHRTSSWTSSWTSSQTTSPTRRGTVCEPDVTCSVARP